MALGMEATVAINPKNHTAGQLIEKVDDLSLDELLDLQGAERASRGRKTVLAAIEAAVDAHQQLADRLDEIVEESSETAVPVAMAVSVKQDRLGSYAAHPGVPGFETLRFGTRAACLAALSARLLG